MALLEPALAAHPAVGSGHEDDEQYDFGWVSGLTLDAKGNIYVADMKLDAIRAYSPTGIYAYTIGRKGSGPGDFRAPGNISIARDGTLWVRDGGNHRFSVLRPEPPVGTFIKSVMMNSNSGTMNRAHWDAAGHAVVITSVPTRAGQPFRAMRQFVDDKGSVVSADTAPAASPDSVELWVIPATGGVAQYSKPGAMSRLTAFGDAGMAAYATKTVYAVSLVDSHGKRIALIKRSVPAVRYSSRETKTLEDARDGIAARTRVPASTLPLDIPRGKPVIATLGFDIDGRLWITRAVPEGAPNEADIYAPDGRWIAVMQWPANVQLSYQAVNGNTGLGVTQDADGGQHVVRLSWK